MKLQQKHTPAIGKCSNAVTSTAAEAAAAAATSFELSLNFDYHPFIIWSYRRHRALSLT